MATAKKPAAKATKKPVAPPSPKPSYNDLVVARTRMNLSAQAYQDAKARLSSAYTVNDLIAKAEAVSLATARLQETEALAVIARDEFYNMKAKAR